jgi:hypothetical protein
MIFPLDNMYNPNRNVIENINRMEIGLPFVQIITTSFSSSLAISPRIRWCMTRRLREALKYSALSFSWAKPLFFRISTSFS